MLSKNAIALFYKSTWFYKAIDYKSITLVINYMSMEAKEIIDALQWRYAVKQYDTSKKLEEDKLHTILEAGRLAPSSAGSQPWKFIVISNQELKEKLSPHAYNQPQITQCSHLVVLCAIKHFDESYIDSHIELTTEKRGVSKEALEGYKHMLIGMTGNTENWLKHQVFIPLGIMLLTAAELHVDASPMGWFSHEEFDEVLWLKEQWLTSVVLMWLGYRNPQDPAATHAKVRWPEEKVIARID